MTFMGRYVEHDGSPAVRFERVFPHPVDHIWAAVTEPHHLVQWFPSAVTIEPRVGGVMEFSGDPHMASTRGEVLTWEPPSRLAFGWGDDAVYLDLESFGPRSTQLTLTDVLSDSDTAARNAAGWTICLGELANVVDGYQTDGPHSPTNRDAFNALYADYCASGMPFGADIPTS